MGFSKLGSEIFINTTTADDQFGASVAQLTGGKIIVAWTDENGSSTAVRGQLLEADGSTASGGEFLLNTTGADDQFDVSVTALGNGGFAAGWTSSAAWTTPWDMSNTGIQNHIVTQIFNSAGTKVGNEETWSLDQGDYSTDFNFDDLGLDEFFQTAPAMTANTTLFTDHFNLLTVEELYLHRSSFGFVQEAAENNLVNFSIVGGGERLIFANDLNGEDITWDYESGSIPTPHIADLDRFHDPQAVTLADNTVVTAYWREANASNLGGVHVDIDGQSGTVRMGSDDGVAPAIAELDNGNLVVVWTDTIGSSDGHENIRGQILEPDGTKVGGEFNVVTTSDAQWTPDVAALADGRFVVVWEDLSGGGGDASESSIKGQIFTFDGIKSGEEFLVNSVTDDNQFDPSVAGLDDGNFIVTWTSADGATDDIKSQVFDPRVYTGDSSDEVVYGGSDADQLEGGAGSDTLNGRLGDDTFKDVMVDDITDGDQFNGGGGIDTIDFDQYVYTLFSPDPVLIGEGGTINSVEVINLHGSETQAGLNFIALAIPLGNTATDGVVTVNGGVGQDIVYGDRIVNADVSLVMKGNGSGDQLVGGAGDDTLEGGEGNDTLEGGGGGDDFKGGTGTDRVDYSSALDRFFSDDDLIVDLTAGTGDIAADGDTFNSIENVTGSQFNDEITGNASANILDGLDGTDVLEGERGADTLNGGGGDDYLDGGNGSDVVDGSTGIDTLWFNDVVSPLVVTFAEDGADGSSTGQGTDILRDIENVVLGIFDNTFTGNSEANVVLSLNGNDSLAGLGGADYLFSFEGADTIDGGGGADTIIGGLGADTLTGGAGADVFVYASSADTGLTIPERDAIIDFVHLVDEIDVSALDGQTSVNGKQDFVFIGTDDFTAEGQFRVLQSGADTLVRFNATGADDYETALLLKNTTAADLTADDFLT